MNVTVEMTRDDGHHLPVHPSATRWGHGETWKVIDPPLHATSFTVESPPQWHE